MTSQRTGVLRGCTACCDDAVVHRFSDLAADAVVSHASAAVLLGLPLWNVPLGHVHVTRCRRSGARRSSGAHVHAAPLESDEIVVVDGLRLTSPARTVVDLARWLPFEQAVVAAAGSASSSSRGQG